MFHDATNEVLLARENMNCLMMAVTSYYPYVRQKVHENPMKIVFEYAFFLYLHLFGNLVDLGFCRCFART